MKLASKILAALAVIASFSSFAGDIDVQVEAFIDIASAKTLAEATTDIAYAAIVQITGGSQAYIYQEGVNSAVISQSATDPSFASIVQTGAANFSAIVQK